MPLHMPRAGDARSFNDEAVDIRRKSGWIIMAGKVQGALPHAPDKTRSPA